MNINAVVRSVQAALGVSVDGNPGPETWRAIHEKIVGKPAPKSAAFAGKADERSEKTIATLHPQVAPYARMLVERAAAANIEIKILSGTRTYAEQDALFAIGRTKEMNRRPVTNAKGGESNHNFGIAFDVGVFRGKDYLGDSPLYATVGAIGMDIGLEWGGQWESFVDMPHYQLRPDWSQGMSEREMLRELRARKASGKDAYAT